jgi:gluconate 2-dehydrogenase gamma chain
MVTKTRREILAASAVAALATPALGRTITGEMPWEPNDAHPPTPVVPGPLQFLTPDEAATIDAIVDRLIPSDELGLGGKDAGCTVFIDRQLAGSYGTNETRYTKGPFPEHTLPSQGAQSPLTPREQYRNGLAALATYCKATFDGRSFEALTPAEQDTLLKGLQKGDVKLPGFSAKMLFTAIHTNAMEGYFADPIYGGNHEMAGWKLVGFPGTRYDYRDVIANPNQPYTRPPVSIQGRAEWTKPSK